MSQQQDIQELYAASYQRLVVQLYAVTGDLGEAQDVVQEAFVKLLAGRQSKLDKPEAWLRTVAVNLARSRWRRTKLLRRLLRQVEAASREVPGVSPDHVALMTAMRQLPAGQRAAIALHYLADLPVAEVAKTLDVSVGTVKSRLSRGREALAPLLRESATEVPSLSSVRSTHDA